MDLPASLPGLVGLSRTNLADLSRTNLADRINGMVSGRGIYGGGLTFNLTTALQGLGDTWDAWDRADRALTERAAWGDRFRLNRDSEEKATGPATGPDVRPREEEMNYARQGSAAAARRFLRGIEPIVDSLHLTARPLEFLRGSPELVAFASMPVPTASERDQVSDFVRPAARVAAALRRGLPSRIRDDWIEFIDSKDEVLVHFAPPIAMLRVDAGGVEVGGNDGTETFRLEFADLARMIDQLHDFLGAATELQ